MHQDTDPGHWFSEVVKALWPAIKKCITKTLKENIEPLIADKLLKFNTAKFGLMSVKFTKIEFGNNAPIFVGMRSSATPSETMWDAEFILPMHDAEIKLEIDWLNRVGGIKTEAILSQIHFHGTIRLGFSQFVNRWPGFGTISVCFTERPFIDFDLEPLGQWGPDLPVVTDLVIDIVRNGMGGAMVWPMQIVVPFLGPEASPDDDIEGVLSVTLVRGKGLQSGTSFMGQSIFTRSPHAVLTIGEQVFTSKTEHDTTSPRWEEQFRFTVHDVKARMLKINVTDDQLLKLGREALLGEAHVDLDAFSPDEAKATELWCPLHGAGGEVAGQILLQLDWIPGDKTQIEGIKKKLEGESGGAAVAAAAGDAFKLKGCVHVELLRARALMNTDTYMVDGTSDPYAIMELGVEKKKATVQPNTVNPEWNEKFKFISSNPDFEIFSIQIFDDDSGVASTVGVNGDDFLGAAEIHVREIKAQGRIVQTYKLEDKARGVTSGELDLSLTWEDMFDADN